MHSGNIHTFTQPALNAKQDQLTFLAGEGATDGWKVVSYDNIVRRLIGDGKIRVLGVLDFLNPGPMTDLQISLDTNLTGLTKYYTKQE